MPTTTQNKRDANACTETCIVCDEQLQPGERREPTIRQDGETGARHWVCSEITTPPNGIIGSLSKGDLFEVKFNCSGEWHYAVAQGTTVCGNEYVLRGRIEDVVYAETQPESPLNYSDEFDVVVKKRGNGWSDPVAFDVESEWPPVTEGLGRSFEYETHHLGDVSVRPTVLHAAQYDWEWWSDRPTDPRGLYERYCVAEQTTYEIGDVFGVSDRTIRRWMDKAGIPRNPEY